MRRVARVCDPSHSCPLHGTTACLYVTGLELHLRSTAFADLIRGPRNAAGDSSGSLVMLKLVSTPHTNPDPSKIPKVPRSRKCKIDRRAIPISIFRVVAAQALWRVTGLPHHHHNSVLADFLEKARTAPATTDRRLTSCVLEPEPSWQANRPV